MQTVNCSSDKEPTKKEMPDGTLQRDCREEMYRSIVEAHTFLQSNKDEDEMITRLRLSYPIPVYFMEASRASMEETTGISENEAFYFGLIPFLTRTVSSQKWGNKPKLNSLSKMSEYLKTLYIGIHVECFYLILLDRQGQLICPVLLQKGAVDTAPFYLRQIIISTLQERAQYIVMTHNHPGGTRYPSREDIMCTLRAINALVPLGIPLLDHIIVAGDSTISIRESGMISKVLWTGSKANSHIVREWLR